MEPKFLMWEGKEEFLKSKHKPFYTFSKTTIQMTTLIITEKPNACKKVAQALADGAINEKKYQKNSKKVEQINIKILKKYISWIF